MADGGGLRWTEVDGGGWRWMEVGLKLVSLLLVCSLDCFVLSFLAMGFSRGYDESPIEENNDGSDDDAKFILERRRNPEKRR